MDSIKQNNPKIFETIQLRLKDLASKQTKVGWLESSLYEDGTPVASIAAQNEFGNPGRGIPPRPTVRPAIIEHQKEWQKMAADGVNLILAGKATAQDIMEGIGETAQGQVYENISKLLEPKLSPITIVARKYKKNGIKITGGTIGQIAALIKSGNMPDVSGISTKPLVDSGLEIATLTSVTENAS
jgi:hypothetical protein